MAQRNQSRMRVLDGGSGIRAAHRAPLASAAETASGALYHQRARVAALGRARQDQSREELEAVEGQGAETAVDGSGDPAPSYEDAKTQRTSASGCSRRSSQRDT